MSASSPLVDRIAERLAGAGIADARAEAARIVDAAGGDEAKAGALAGDRANGTPLAYVIGEQTFLGIVLHAAPGALVPREETEILGRAMLERITESSRAPRVIDMCCGSGNLACALAVSRPTARVWASDLTDGCVALARRNVERVGARDRVTIVQGDLFAPLAGLALESSIDAVVCNPPYISTGRLDKERVELLDHEPREAFDGGPYGLSIHQRVIKDAVAFLVPGGWLMFEIGAGQDRQIKILFDRARVYGEVTFASDAAGVPRAVMAQKRPA